MKKNLILSTLALISFTTFQPVLATSKEENWEKVESGTKLITRGEQKELEEELLERIETLRQSAAELGKNEVYRYKITLNEDDNLADDLEVSHKKSFSSREEAIQWSLENEIARDHYQFIQNTVKPFQIEKIFEKTKYDSEDEANQALMLFNQNLSSSDAKVTKVRNQDKDIKTKQEDNRTYQTEKEALEAASCLEEDTEEFQVTVKVGKNRVADGTEKSEIEKVFPTEKEALAYIHSLEEEGYKVDASVEVVKESKKKEYVGDKRDTEEEAQKDLDAFLEEYPNHNSGKIEKTRDQSKDKTEASIRLEEEFSSLESANERKSSLEEDNDVYQIVATVSHGQKNTSVEEKIESKVFDSELEAEKFVKELQDKGYDTTGLETKLLSYEESVWKDNEEVIVDPGTGDETTFHYGHFDVTLLSSFTEVDANGKESKVTGSVQINSVKINHQNIAMEGPSRDPNTGKNEYTSVSRNDLNVTNKSLVEINGTITFNGKTLPFTVKGYLSEKQNVCGGTGRIKGYDLEFKSIRIVNNKVYVDSNIVNKYQVVGTAIKNVLKDVWYIDTTKTIKGYVYQAVANGEKEEITGYQVKGTKSLDLWKDVYFLDIEKLIKGYDYYVSGKGLETRYDVISTYRKLIEANWLIEKSSLSTGDIEVLPPKTGVEAKNEVGLCVLFIISIFTVFLKKIVKYN